VHDVPSMVRMDVIRRNTVLINKRMTHGGVLRGILRDIERTFGIVNFKNFKNCDKKF
jgi:hypothetical protein